MSGRRGPSLRGWELPTVRVAPSAALCVCLGAMAQSTQSVQPATTASSASASQPAMGGVEPGIGAANAAVQGSSAPVPVAAPTLGGTTDAARVAPNTPPVAEVTSTATPAGSSSALLPSATSTGPGPSASSAASTVTCPSVNWNPRQKATHLPLTGDVSLKSLRQRVVAEIITDADVTVKVGDVMSRAVTFDGEQPVRLTFESGGRMEQVGTALVPVRLAVKAPADWPDACRTLGFTVDVGLAAKVHFALSAGPATLTCEKPCEVASSRKSRPVWGEKTWFEVNLRQGADDAMLPSAVTIVTNGDEVSGKPPSYSLEPYMQAQNLHFELTPAWRFFSVSPRPLEVSLLVGLGNDPSTGAQYKGFSATLTFESVPPWWVRLPIWLLGALVLALASASPLVRKRGTRRRLGWRIASAIVSSVVMFAFVEAAASRLPSAVEEVPWLLWGCFLLGVAFASAGVNLVLRFVDKKVTGGLIRPDAESEAPTENAQTARR